MLFLHHPYLRLLHVRMLLFQAQIGDGRKLDSAGSQATRNDVRPSFTDKHVNHNRQPVHRGNAPRNVTARNATANVWLRILTF